MDMGLFNSKGMELLNKTANNLLTKKSDAEKAQDKDTKAYIKDFKKIATTNIDNLLLYSETTGEVVTNRTPNFLIESELFNRADIRSFEVIQDGEKSEKFGVGGAAVGAVLLGPVGLLGGFLLKKKKNNISDLRVRIYTVGATTMHDVVLINSKMKANGLVATAAFKSLDKIVEFLQSAILNAEPEVKDSSSNADQLMKLKELLDGGVLSQNEFDAEKTKIIG